MVLFHLDKFRNNMDGRYLNTSVTDSGLYIQAQSQISGLPLAVMPTYKEGHSHLSSLFFPYLSNWISLVKWLRLFSLDCPSQNICITEIRRTQVNIKSSV